MVAVHRWGAVGGGFQPWPVVRACGWSTGIGWAVAEGSWKEGEQNLSSAWLSDQGNPSVSSIAWAGAGWPPSFHARDKDGR